VSWKAVVLTVWAGLAAGLLLSCPKTKPVDPIPLPPPVITCKLPAGPGALPDITRQTEGCPGDWTCFNLENSARLAERLDRMETWIHLAKKACVAARDAGVD
jgi:hypothetical protein